MSEHPKKLRVAIVGLGFVGLTLGVAMARRGIQVVGLERRPDVAELISKGKPHFSEVGLAEALEHAVRNGLLSASTSIADLPPCDYYILTVGTPLHPQTHLPRLDMIEAASREVAEHMGEGASVILRSTVQIGTTRSIVKPILDASGKAYDLAMCPERTLEGDALRELFDLPQIIGGIDDVSADRAASLFSRLTHTLVRVADLETAEMMKLVDNTFRDVHFAFSNEIARACDAIGINANDVIKFGKLGYTRTNLAKPGLVGGPCLGKDPHILMSSLQNYGVSLDITTASRLVNERQPFETVETMLAILNGRELTGPYKVAVAGMAFKGVPETDDLRGSMALKVLEALAATGKMEEIRIFDPVISVDELKKLPQKARAFAAFSDALQGAHLTIICNNHKFFAKVRADEYFAKLDPNGIVYDYWNNLEHESPENLQGRYFTVGNASLKRAV